MLFQDCILQEHLVPDELITLQNHQKATALQWLESRYCTAQRSWYAGTLSAKRFQAMPQHPLVQGKGKCFKCPSEIQNPARKFSERISDLLHWLHLEKGTIYIQCFGWKIWLTSAQPSSVVLRASADSTLQLGSLECSRCMCKCAVLPVLYFIMHMLYVSIRQLLLPRRVHIHSFRHRIKSRQAENVYVRSARASHVSSSRTDSEM